MTTFNDISRWQGTVDWAAHCAHRDVAIIRAYTGYSVDPQFARNRSQAHANGIKALGLYHYVAHDVDIESQAQAFLNTVGTLAPNEFLVMDDEDPGLEVVGACHAWTAYVESRTGRKAMIYFGGQNGNAMTPAVTGGRIRWVARYSDTPPACPYDIWQHTSSAAAPGIAGRCDESITGLTVNQILNGTGGAGGTDPKPPATQDEEESVNIIFRTPANGNFWLVSGESLVHLATEADVAAAKKVAKTCVFTQDQLNQKNFTNALKAPGAYLLRGTPSNACRLIGGGHAVPMLPGGNVKTLQAAGVKLVTVSDKGLTAAWKDIK